MIFAIGDLHLDHSKAKPMDIFGAKWINHEENIISKWKDIIKEDDLVILPGDISWALKLNDAKEDLKLIDNLPGKKIMIKGNHDYWWESFKKLNDLSLKSTYFIQNNSYNYKEYGIAGTRGWISRDSDGFNKDDEKIFLRELARLRNSLLSLDKSVKKRIVILHYPPFNINLEPNEFVEIMKDSNVDICLYGHLHAEGHKYAVEGNIEGITFHCVSSDFIDFKPKKIIGE